VSCAVGLLSQADQSNGLTASNHLISLRLGGLRVIRES
jgi:hypothetical protein